MTDEPIDDTDAVDSAYFVDARHCLYAGWVAGVAMRNRIDFEFVHDDEGNFTDLMVIHLPRVQNSVTYGLPTPITIAIPYPPEDWIFRS